MTDITASNARTWHSPSLIAWLMIVAASITLFTLSYWQLQRLAWKQGIISQLEHYASQPASTAIPTSWADADAVAYSRVQLTGQFMHAHELHLTPRYYNSQLGYHIMTPFAIEDGGIMLVNRGWVPVDNKDPATRSDAQLHGTQHIIAMIRTDPDRHSFTPDNNPEDNLWFSRDVELMAESVNLDTYPYSVDLLYNTPSAEYPIASQGLVSIRNDHLGYAITWGLIGLTGIVIFVLYHYRPTTLPQQTD